MAHDLDTTDGQTSFASAREHAWHRLGTVLEESFDAEQAMREANLGRWNVRKLPLFAVDYDRPGVSIEVPRNYAIVRDNPVIPGRIDALGVVGGAYKPVQNEDHAELLNALVDESGAHFETAGALDGGRKVFLTMRFPESVRVGGVDPVDLYLAAVNSHDSSMALTFLVTPVRVVCANTLGVALRNASNTFRVRHTSRVEKVVRSKAREALGMTFSYLDGFAEEAERMISTSLTDARFEEIIQAEFGAPTDAPDSTLTRGENKLDVMRRLFAEANTQAGIRNTAWAGFNAVTEYVDHFAPVRGEDRANRRAEKAVLGSDAFKTRALRAFAPA